MKSLNTIKNVKQTILIASISFSCSLFGQNSNPNLREFFSPDLHEIFKEESVSNIAAKWKKNGFDVSDQSQNSLKNQLNVIYNKFKVNKKFIIMTGCGISTNLRVAKLKAEANTLGQLLTMETKVSSSYLNNNYISHHESNNKISLDNVMTLEILKPTNENKFEIWRFYIFYKEDLEYFSACHNCFEGQSTTYSMGISDKFSNTLIVFLNDLRTINIQTKQLNLEGDMLFYLSNIDELTKDGLFQASTNNEKEDIKFYPK